MLQNAGIARTSVSHAALLIGAAPVLVAIIAARRHDSVARPVALAGFAVSLAGARLSLAGRETAQLSAAMAWCLRRCCCRPHSPWRRSAAARPRPGRGDRRTVPGGGPRRASRRCGRRRHACGPSSLGTLLATAVLAVGGTLAPFTLFAYGQARVPERWPEPSSTSSPWPTPSRASSFLPTRPARQQVTGFAAILAGIALGSLPLLGNHRRGTAPPFAPSRLCAGAVLEPGILVRSEIAAELPRLPPA